jgi:hypothetical protein
MPFKSVEALAYAAGLFEGEGNVNAHYGTALFTRNGEKIRYIRRSPQFVLQIGMTDLEPLEKFLEAVGLGQIYGPYKLGKSHFKKSWHYRVGTFEGVQAIAAMLWKWLSPRRRKQVVATLLARRKE